MAKAVKKKGKNRRLKRSIRKTLGALFLASALAVAAIPTEGLQAADGNAVAVNNGRSVSEDIFGNHKMPLVDSNATIYTYPMEGTGVTFRFAYVEPSSGKEETESRVAVILGYTQIGNLAEGTLRIPDTMEAYRKYSLTSTDTGSVAVNMDNQFLYYLRKEPVLDANNQPIYEKGDPTQGDRVDQYGNKLDSTGKPIPVTRDVYYPCYYATRSTWVNDTILYEADGATVSGNQPASYKASVKERISRATVAYIGNQYLTIDDNGEWRIGEDGNPTGVIQKADQGIFYNQTNITNLIVGKDVMGIGDYAFTNCGLRSVTFGNGLGCLGNNAFQNCGNLSEVKFDLSASVSVLGSHCFNNCISLQTLNLPGNIQQIGDSAFEGCQNLVNLNMIHEGYAGSLTTIGKDAFKDCSALTSLEFPYTYSEQLDVSVFQGCSSLSHIKTAGNSTFALKAGDVSNFGFEQFKETVLKAFYLEGPKTCALHTTATEQRIAYKFHDPDLNMDVYELVVDETGSGGKVGVIYWVNEEGRIVRCEMENSSDKMEVITLPEVVGPKNIVGIDSGTFQNKCWLKTITIPASVTYIAENAFKGSHRLENVIFTQAENIETIGAGAFNTQAATGHIQNCTGLEGRDAHLNFVGTISSTCRPFTYAMTPSEYINTGSQYRTYITYYSGWPTNLVVRYNEATDSNELIDYPTFSELAAGNKYTTQNYAYMTDELVAAAAGAVSTYNTPNASDYEKQIINAVLNLELPDGIESIATVDASGNLVEDAGSVSGGDAGAVNKGLFAYKEQADKALINTHSIRKTLTTESLQEVNPGAFRDCDTIAGVTFNGPIKSIGNYAFDNCDNLSAVNISESIDQLGLRPFTDCKSLSNVNFNGSEKFSCDSSIIFELGTGKSKDKVVEYLCGRVAGSVKPEELAGVTEIYPEAFMSTGVRTIDLSQSAITDVPESAFRETSSLFQVVLPNTCRSISQHAFTDSSIYEVTIPRSVSVISNDAFRDVKQGDYTGMTNTTEGHLVFYCADDSVAAIFADKYTPPIHHEAVKEPVYYKVTFWDYDRKSLGIFEKVEEGSDASGLIEAPTREGYTFTGWVPPVDCIKEDTQATAQYQIIDPETQKVTVRFIDWDDDVIKEGRVVKGENIELPRDPSRDGYIFTGWRPIEKPAELVDGRIENVQADMDIYAQYEKIDPTSGQHLVRFLDEDGTLLAYQRVDDGKDAKLPKDPPPKAGYTFYGWQPEPTNVIADMDVYARYIQNSNGNGDNNGDNNGGNGTTSGNGSGNNGNNGNNNGNGTTSGNGSGNNGSTAKFYTLTVQNGSGSGSYVAGAQPIVIANDPSPTQEFSHWTIDPENTTIASKVLSATVITMPEGNVTVTAHYRARTSSSNGSGSSSSANSVRRPNNTGTISNSGTTVVIDKNGISNTGVVAATVNGSSDNFVIKITESSEASEAAVRALMAEYGSLDNIKYFPMDISLYDSTGTNKITDTTGLSVDITLPLPDSLITYAGNNKVAGVVNDRLDKLTPRFTTISGVSCITFRAEHFSPYVIYVDTANLSAGGSADSTPKTGDGIHPKWFLSVGLACLSFVMFMQKDKRKPQKVKAKAKA